MGQVSGDTIRIVAIGGSTRPDSSSERALLAAVRGARAKGAHVDVITSRDLLFPIYDTETTDRDPLALAYLAKVAQADGLIIASPSYHGAISGMMKNALDYIEDLRDREGGYLHGMSVGCISVAHGWQATVSTLQQLRQIVHALRGWPTPLGATVNAGLTKLDAQGNSDDTATVEQLELVGHQVVEFANMKRQSKAGAQVD
ncbi:MAG: NAD(P)H-dependent oxidoreductase [Actinomycetota bacterium]|nr:NAD(P)H-dependent oxidoreductase [Actinomycetota bacterium]